MIWGLRKKFDPNDPTQLELLDVLGESAILELTAGGTDDWSAQVALFIIGQGWSKRESQQRIEAILAAVAGSLESRVRERARLVAARAIKRAFD
jgi:hypothetical protein